MSTDTEARAEDYLEYTEAVNNTELGQLNELAKQQTEAEQEIEQILKDLQAAKDRLKVIAETRLPELMDKLNLTEFKTSTGLTITVSETIRASIPKPRTLEALRWLIDHNHSSLIKSEVKVEFSKDELERANELKEQLLENNYAPTVKTSVHPQTLSAFCREQLEAGEDIPTELFGVFRQRSSIVKRG